MSHFNTQWVCFGKLFLFCTLIISTIQLDGQNSNSCDIRSNDAISTQSSRGVVGQATSLSREGYNEWTNLGNAVFEDRSSISVTIDARRSSEVLQLNDFGFDLPNNVNITGIQVRMAGNSDAELSPWEMIVQLTDASGNPVSDNRAGNELEGSAWNLDTLSSVGHWTYGSSADLWGTSWTGADINSSNFGILLQSKNRQNTEITLNLDQVLIIVYYDSPILICEDHNCIPVFVDFDPNVISYNWSVQGGLTFEPSSNNPNIINVTAENVPFGDYLVCLERTYNDGRIETCCRGIDYQDCSSASIGDFVWRDLNGNGLQDPGESGIPNCRVFLFTESLDFVGSMLTDDNGNYLFTDLAPGNYIIQVDQKDYCPTINNSTNPDLNSDFFVAFLPNGSRVFNLSSGQDRRDIDFGLVRKGVIEGMTFIDVNGDGILDPSIDVKIPDVKVSLVNSDQVVIECVISGPDGIYAFNNVPVGDYTLKFDFPVEFIPTIESVDNQLLANNCTNVITVDEDDVIVINAGVFRPAALGDFVWLDSNDNGIQDPDEPGIEGALVSLFSCMGQLIGEMTTDANGFYLFEGLAPGNYMVCVDPQRNDLVPTTRNISSEDLDSDSGEDGCSSCITLLENTTDLNIDFGFIEGLIDIDVYIFNDFNQDNFADENEPDFPGITVEIFTCDGQLIQTEITDDLGGVWFNGIPADEYYFRVSLPRGFDFTEGGVIDGTFGPGTTRCFNGTPPGFSLEIGIFRSAVQIDVYTFIDANGNNIDDNELPLGGVGVEVFRCDGTLIGSLTSDEMGASWIFDVPQGDYYIRITAPEGFDLVMGNGIITNANGPNTTNCFNTFPVGFSLDIPLIETTTQPELAQIDVYTFIDANGNNIDDNELPLGGVGVEVFSCDGTLVGSLTSNEMGASWIFDVPQGDYYIRITAPEGFDLVMGNGIITNANGPNTTNCFNTFPVGFSLDIPFVRTESDTNIVTISGSIFTDNNGSFFNDNEPPLDGVTVSLFDCSNNLIATTVSDADGQFSFENINEGDYYIRFESLSGFEIASGNGSDVDNSNGVGTTACMNFDGTTNVEAGFIPLSSIGDFVWLDIEASGVQDAGDPGISNMNVILEDANGSQLSTVTTDSNGLYMFSNIRPGTYRVVLEDIGDFVATAQNIGDPNFDSNLGSFNGVLASEFLTISDGVDRLDIDLGLSIEQAILGGLVFNDQAGDGVLRNNDQRIPGIPVSLFDENGNFQQSTETDADGSYRFLNIIPGNYYVQFDIEDDQFFTTANVGTDELFDSDVIDASGRTDLITLESGDVIQGVNAGIVSTLGCVSGVLWNDSNRDGILDNADASIAGGNTSNLRLTEEGRIGDAVVNLFTEDDVLVSTALTDTEGQYEFCDLAPGNYYVQFILPTDFVFSPPNQGTDETLDSEVIDPINGSTDIITVISGVSIDNVNAGAFLQNTIVGGTVWLDENLNGILDDNENGISNIVINLRDENNTIVLTTQSNLDGDYRFTDPNPGSYFLQIVFADSLQLTESRVGNDPSVYSHFDQATRFTDQIDVTEGSFIDIANAGLVESQSGFRSVNVSGLVWLDENRNGLLDNIERGVSNVSVEVIRPDETIAESVTTGPDGNYMIDELVPGDYKIRVLERESYDLTESFVGNDPTTQSHFIPITRESTLLSIDEGAVISNMNAGFLTKPGSISGTAWNDENENGRFGNNENVISGLTVNLLDINRIRIAMTTTDANGQYRFDNLEPDVYIVHVIRGDQYESTTSFVGIDPTIYSHILVASGTTPVTRLESGQNLEDINIGLIEVEIEVPDNNLLSGYVWEDMDANGSLDADEEGQNGIRVRLLNEIGALVGVTNTTNNPDLGDPGFYSFDNVDSGNYTISFDIDDQASITRLGSDSKLTSEFVTDAFDFDSQSGMVVSAGYFFPGSIGDYVWNDLDQDGIQDADESGANQFFIRLFNTQGDQIAFTFSDSDGAYSFDNLFPGEYYVEVDFQIGFSFSPANEGTDESDTNITNENGIGTTSNITIESGTVDNSIDIGLIISPASVGDFVFVDDNANGVQDDNENGLNDINVFLFDTNDNIVDQTVTATVDGQDGKYLFEDVNVGDYYIVFDIPENMEITIKDQGGDDSKDSDVDNSQRRGSTSIFDLSAGELDLDIDAGVIIDLSIGNTVWQDDNNDGLLGISEPGVADVIVTLYDADGNYITETQTDDNGNYRFSNLNPAQYSLHFGIPETFVFTERGTGASIFESIAHEDGTTDIIDLQDGSSRSDINAGLISPNNEIAGLAWLDENSDGIYDNNEPLLEGISVRLNSNIGQVIDVTETGPTGRYVFPDLPNGAYVIEFGLDSGFDFTNRDEGSDDTLDSDVSSTGRTTVIGLGGQAVQRYIYAGFVTSRAPGFTEVYPNPVSDGMIDLRLKARYDDTTPLFQLFNMNGQLVDSWTAELPQAEGWKSYRVQLDNTLQDGYYTLKIQVGRIQEIHKVILVRG
jgi:protocatechuate 3,4-dioxygenase beta subunit